MNINPQTEAAREAARREDGKFGNQQHAESAVSIAPAVTHEIFTVPDPTAPLPTGKSMSAYELGLRTDTEGLVTFRIQAPLGSITLDTSDESFDEITEYLPGGCYPQGVSLTPIAVKDGEIIMDVTTPSVDSGDAEHGNDQFAAERERGQADRQRWLRLGRGAADHMDLNHLLTEDDGRYLRDVPPMPDGTPDDVVVEAYDDDNDFSTITELRHQGRVVARLRLTEKFVGEHETDFYTGDRWSTVDDDVEEAPDWVNESQYEYEGVLEAVAKNRKSLVDTAAARAVQSPSLAAKINEMALGGINR